MAAHSQAAGLAQIDLTVEGPGNCTPVGYSHRQIILSATDNVVTIGRSSKVAAKGFVPGHDNAWFDSAVMSRDHAEICVDMEEKKVQVRDKGSLHGTYLNKLEKLEKKPRELRDGDRLTFGLPIDRGTSTFLPVSVKVGVSFNNPSNRYVPSSPASSALTETFSVGDDCGTSTFQVPDDSDCSSDVDSYTSDNSAHSSNSATMSSKIASKVQHSLPSKPIAVIDLTGTSTSHQNHTWARTSGQRSYNDGGPVYIDISSPPSSPLRIQERRNHKSAPCDARVPNEVEVLQLDVPDLNVVSERQEPIHDVASLGAATSRIAELASTLGQTAQALEAMEPSFFDSDIDSDCSSDHSVDSEHHDNDSDLSDAESNIDYPEEFRDSESSSDDDSSSGSDDEMDYQSDHSSALNEDMESLDYSDNESAIAGDEGAIADLEMFDLAPAPSPLLLSMPVGRPNWSQGSTIPAASDEHDDTLTNTMTECTSPVLPANEKKDQAVIKNSSPIAIEKLLNDRPGLSPTILHPLPELRRDDSPKPWLVMGAGSYESLGTRTGKVDFFAAREENKAYFNKTFGQPFNKAVLDTQTTLRPASSVYALCNEPIRPRFETEQVPAETSGPRLLAFSRLPPLSQETPSSYSENEGSVVAQIFDRLSKRTASRRANFAATTAEETVVTKEPEAEQPVAQGIETTESEASKPDSGEVAVQKTEGQPVVASSNSQPLVQTEQPEPILTKRKRKAEDISEQTTADRYWDGPVSSATPEAPKADEAITAITTEADSQLERASIQLPLTFERPTKRVKLFRLAERVGIAAIGGAMVMGTLIYTAPTFA
ncbi:hypothetical protein QBC40DRAFT_303743 [Triangularia verruculosa]|uniref:FHA domain-containing protein n=1 Tax=Triangularia verruculosa TaxID=2587418 RepID=A0AAN6XPX4_9PEZI|nr:hypothetical protein QBC40DRAFT_303743 [Triangularia verruculosa]